MANPPFTGNIDKGDINESLQLPTTKTELPFVERIYNMLKMGGTAAVIVPSGVIQNSGKAFEAVCKLIIEQVELYELMKKISSREDKSKYQPATDDCPGRHTAKLQ